MTELEKAARQALEALNLARAAHGQMLMSDPPQEAWKAWNVTATIREAMDALRSALEQPAQQEPVAWAKKAMELAADLSIESLRLGSYERKDTYEHAGRASWQTVEIRQKREDARERLRQHIYTSPPAQRKPLTDEQILKVKAQFSGTLDVQFIAFTRAIEAAHGIKE
jgi:DNA-directed RNA polymerase specialized sigma24 family protein